MKVIQFPHYPKRVDLSADANPYFFPLLVVSALILGYLGTFVIESMELPRWDAVLSHISWLNFR